MATLSAPNYLIRRRDSNLDQLCETLQKEGLHLIENPLHSDVIQRLQEIYNYTINHSKSVSAEQAQHSYQLIKSYSLAPLFHKAMCKQYIECSDYDSAIELAEKSADREEILTSLAFTCCKMNELDHAIEIAKKLSPGLYQNTVLLEILDRSLEEKQHEMTKRVAKILPGNLAAALYNRITQLAKNGNFDLSIALVRLMPNGAKKESALTFLIYQLKAANKIEEAKELSQQITDPSLQTNTKLYLESPQRK